MHVGLVQAEHAIADGGVGRADNLRPAAQQAGPVAPKPAAACRQHAAACHCHAAALGGFVLGETATDHIHRRPRAEVRAATLAAGGVAIEQVVGHAYGGVRRGHARAVDVGAVLAEHATQQGDVCPAHRQHAAAETRGGIVAEDAVRYRHGHAIGQQPAAIPHAAADGEAFKMRAVGTNHHMLRRVARRRRRAVNRSYKTGRVALTARRRATLKAAIHRHPVGQLQRAILVGLHIISPPRHPYLGAAQRQRRIHAFLNGEKRRIPRQTIARYFALAIN